MAGGRQREFNEEIALDNAMRVFWQKGYLGSSLSDLTQSMGINKPSLYATFGNKETLFIRATERYLNQYTKQFTRLLHQKNKSLRDRIKNYLLAIVDMQCDASNPKGCYLAMCISETAGEGMPPAALQAIKKAGHYSEEYLKEFFEAEINAGHMSKNPGAGVISCYLLTVLNGTSSVSRGGKSRDDIDKMINYTINSLPFIE